LGKLSETWELRSEPFTKEAVLELVSLITDTDEEGESLIDAFGEESSIDQMLQSAKRRAEVIENYNPTHDFYVLVGALNFIVLPGWRVSTTLLSDGRLSYAHRPKSVDEMMGELVFVEGTAKILSQLVDFIELHGVSDDFRQFFYGTYSY